MAILGFELEEIARLLALAESQGLEEFIFEEEGRYLRIRAPRHRKLTRPSAAQTPPEAAAPARQLTRPAQKQIAPPPAASGALAANQVALAANQVALTAPMVGVFYRSEKPGASPFVNVGDPVSVGQTVGVIEAMKVFSEFKAETSGTIVAIPAEDGQLVQTGATLFILQQE